MENKKKNVPLIVALSIPILMIVFIAVSIYLPSLFIKPTMDFIYATGGDYYSRRQYVVQNEKIEERKIENPYPNNPNYQPPHPTRLFYYDVAKDTSREISLAEAQQYTIDSSSRSPDGFEVVSGNSSYDIFSFGGSSYYAKYLKKGGYSHKLNMENYYYYEFQLIGWVKG